MGKQGRSRNRIATKHQMLKKKKASFKLMEHIENTLTFKVLKSSEHSEHRPLSMS